MKCLNCNDEIINPTRSDQKFCKRPCFNEYRKKHAKVIKKKKIDGLENIILPAAPAHSLSNFEDMTISQIKTKFAELQVKLLEVSSYKHKYAELLIKLKELIPVEQEEQIIFIKEDGTRISGGRAVKVKDGLAKFVREIKKKPEELVEENNIKNEIELESAVNPILKD